MLRTVEGLILIQLVVCIKYHPSMSCDNCGIYNCDHSHAAMFYCAYQPACQHLSLTLSKWPGHASPLFFCVCVRVLYSFFYYYSFFFYSLLYGEFLDTHFVGSHCQPHEWCQGSVHEDSPFLYISLNLVKRECTTQNAARLLCSRRQQWSRSWKRLTGRDAGWRRQGLKLGQGMREWKEG